MERCPYWCVDGEPLPCTQSGQDCDECQPMENLLDQWESQILASYLG